MVHDVFEDEFKRLVINFLTARKEFYDKRSIFVVSFFYFFWRNITSEVKYWFHLSVCFNYRIWLFPSSLKYKSTVINVNKDFSSNFVGRCISRLNVPVNCHILVVGLSWHISIYSFLTHTTIRSLPRIQWRLINGLKFFL